MKHLFTFICFLIASAHAGASTFPVEKLEAKLTLSCKDSSPTLTLFRFNAYIESEPAPFFQVETLKNLENFKITSDGEVRAVSGEESLRIGKLAYLPAHYDCAHDEYFRQEFSSEILLDVPFEAGLGSAEINESCRAGGTFEFKGNVRRELYTDLFLIDTRTEVATKLGRMLFFTEKDSCANLRLLDMVSLPLSSLHCCHSCEDVKAGTTLAP